MQEQLKLVRKRGGRSYIYRTGMKMPKTWFLRDEKGNEYKTFEDYEQANKPKVVKKKAAPKTRAEINKDKE